MDIASLTALVNDKQKVPNCNPKKHDPETGKSVSVYGRDEVVPVEIFCSDGGFAAFSLASGKFATICPGHITVFESKEEMVDSLNAHEKQLYVLKVLR